MDDSSNEPDIDPLWDDPATSDNAVAPKQRPDGWTPFARRLFLTVLADTGRVSLACEYTQRSRATAYALRARDPVFAASWDAACELARAPLADALYERALDGTTETITRNGEIVAERHRHDNRLSMAVLHRLDKRCDRAAEQGARHLAIAARWNEWLQMIGNGEESSALEQLESPATEPARHCQLCQLPLGESPTGEDVSPPEEDEASGLSTRCWQDEEGGWMTNFPPPTGFDGYEKGHWRDYGYKRDCTAEEAEILDASEDAAQAEEQAEDAAVRDAWFALLRNESAERPESDAV